ncbi:MAG TPA: PRC-barrel domain-containing protein [Thermoleophilia bacterium]|nr:PRC-barrel domain-containing protein [Thermoleophilia bacterium]
MATVPDRDYVGLTAYSRDGTKLGRVKDVMRSGDTAEYLVIGGFLSRGRVVPCDVVTDEGNCLIVPFMSSYLDMAPSIDSRKPVSSSDRERLRNYYHTRES